MSEGNGKVKRNPFRMFERGARRVGDWFPAVILILIAIFWLVAVPILGFAGVLSADLMWVGWLSLGFLIVIILLFWGVSVVAEYTIARPWRKARDAWDRKHR